MEEIEKPPLFKKWHSWYYLVLVFMLIQVVFYFFLTRYFA
jgi:hypothetical protein